MKKFNAIFGLFVLVAVVFSSCGSDDGPDPVLKTETKSYTYTAVIKGLAPDGDGKVEYTLPDFQLSDILGAENAKNFKAAEFQNSGTYLEITGLKAMSSKPELKNFTLQVNSDAAVNLGTCKSENVNLGNKEFPSDEQNSSNTYISFINTIFTKLISKDKKASLKISFTPTQDIVEANNVLLKITINAKYSYNTYPAQ